MHQKISDKKKNGQKYVRTNPSPHYLWKINLRAWQIEKLNLAWD